jgi:hypothetical protein
VDVLRGDLLERAVSPPVERAPPIGPVGRIGIEQHGVGDGLELPLLACPEHCRRACPEHGRRTARDKPGDQYHNGSRENSRTTLHETVPFHRGSHSNLRSLLRRDLSKPQRAAAAANCGRSIDWIESAAIVQLFSATRAWSTRLWAGRVEFDGVDDALFVDVHPLAGAETFTWEAIFRPDGGREAQRWFHLQEEGSENRMLFEIRVIDGQWCLDSYGHSGDAQRALMNRQSLHPLGAWYHVAAVYDGREFRNT